MSTVTNAVNSPVGKLAGNITHPPTGHVSVWVLVAAAALAALGFAIIARRIVLRRRGRLLGRWHLKQSRQRYFAAVRQYGNDPDFVPHPNMTMDRTEQRRQRRYDRNPARGRRRDMRVLQDHEQRLAEASRSRV